MKLILFMLMVISSSIFAHHNVLGVLETSIFYDGSKDIPIKVKVAQDGLEMKRKTVLHGTIKKGQVFSSRIQVSAENKFRITSPSHKASKLGGILFDKNNQIKKSSWIKGLSSFEKKNICDCQSVPNFKKLYSPYKNMWEKHQSSKKYLFLPKGSPVYIKEVK